MNTKPKPKFVVQIMKYLSNMTLLLFFSLAVVSCGKAETGPQAGGNGKDDGGHEALKKGAKVGVWTQDYEAAKKLAKEKGLPLFMNFSGSDWCYWCQWADQNFFSKEKWQDYAKENLVLVLIDFPQDESLVPAAYRERNQKLQQKWMVRGFPTFLLLDSDGENALGKLGIMPDDSVEDFVERVKKAASSKAEEDASVEPVKMKPTEIHAAFGAGEEVSYLDQGVKDGVWTQDRDAAVEAAKKDGKPILFLFTGSDWSPSCKSIHRTVLSRASWQRYARENLVLFVLDFPRQKTLPKAVVARNEKIRDSYGVNGYPTFLLFDSDGKTLIGSVDNAMSPREFKQNIKDVLALWGANVEKVAAKLDGPQAAQYRQIAAELRSKTKELKDLDAKAKRLYRIGALTKEVREKLNALNDETYQLNARFDYLQHVSYASELPKTTAARYLQLAEELRKANDNFRNWLKNNDSADTTSKLASHRETTRIIEEAMADIEHDYAASKLTEARATKYRQLVDQLRRKKSAHQNWLESDPENTEENLKLQQRMLDEIDQLQDRIDAMRGI